MLTYRAVHNAVWGVAWLEECGLVWAVGERVACIAVQRNARVSRLVHRPDVHQALV